jgi:aspartyl/asparaginyl-tRNA synthetase
VVQVIDVIEQMFKDIFSGIESSCKAELAALAQQYPFEPFVMKPMRFTYADGVKVRRRHGLTCWVYSYMCSP